MTGSVPSFALSAAVAYAATPLAIRAARRTGFLDHPYGYKAHKEPTPYLGGTAVFGAFLIAAFAFSGATRHFAALLACAAGLWLLGSLDDRFAVSPRWRVLAEIAAGCVLASADLGWTVFNSETANLIVTVIWVVGLVNAFNLMDNLDGATASVAAASCAAIGAYALADGKTALGALAFAVCGACLGFLPWNLAGPAKIFLGDGGSMPIGLLVAGLAIGAADEDSRQGSAVIAGGLLVGLAILDTTLVTVSRRRAGISLLQGGRDHLTHRLLTRLNSPRWVALALGAGQLALGGLALAGDHIDPFALIVIGTVTGLLGVAVIALLETDAWRPPRPEPARADAAPVAVRRRRVGLRFVEAEQTESP